MINIGVTATRQGLTAAQLQAMFLYLRRQTRFNTEIRLHHGCCVGGDEQLAILGYTLEMTLVAHPPDNKRYFSQLAFDLSDEKRDEFPYLVRNRNIVDDIDVLLAGPKETRPVLRSGTWSTVRYAMSTHTLTNVFTPNGHHTVLREDTNMSLLGGYPHA